MVRHVVTKPLGHGAGDGLLVAVEPHMVGVHMDHLLPARARKSQRSPDIAERLSDLVGDRFGELPVIVPAALTGDLDPVADLDCRE